MGENVCLPTLSFQKGTELQRSFRGRGSDSYLPARSLPRSPVGKMVACGSFVLNAQGFCARGEEEAAAPAAASCVGSYIHSANGFVARGGSAPKAAGFWCMHQDCIFAPVQWCTEAALQEHTAASHAKPTAVATPASNENPKTHERLIGVHVATMVWRDRRWLSLKLAINNIQEQESSMRCQRV